jgi:DNA helicase-2/ATP-dependent DNA helicase PcrA
VVGGTRFYERREVKDALAYLRVVANPADDLSLERVINVPPRGVGTASLAHLRSLGLPLLEACRSASELPARCLAALGELVETLDRLRLEREDLTLPGLMRRAVEDTGYAGWLERQGTEEALGRLDNLRELASLAESFARDSDDPSLDAFLAFTALVADVDSLEEGEGGVVLMTAHNAKGLEFPTVFLVGLEEGLFPHARSLEGQGELEEERRLLYVGVTRAQEELLLSYARTRVLFGRPTVRMPSRFLGEIPETLLRRCVDKPPPTPRPAMKVEHSAPGDDDAFHPGERVLHPKWGVGTVVARRPTGDDIELTLAFPGMGVKKVLASLARLSRA